MIEELALELIRQDGGTQPRAFMNSSTVDDYKEILEEGGSLPPVDVFYDGTDYWLADGYHRIQAAKQVGFKTFPCTIHQGNIEAAQWFSFGANKSHGLRRTNKDKQRAVEAALAHPKAINLSNVEIAEHCGVSEITVRRHKELSSTLSKIDNSTRTVTRKGKTYKQKTANIGKGKKKESEPEPEKPVQPASQPEPESDYKPTFRSEKVEVQTKVSAIVAIEGAKAALRKTPPDVEGALRELESADI